jgi:lysophospholipase L1-like esterase
MKYLILLLAFNLHASQDDLKIFAIGNSIVYGSVESGETPQGGFLPSCYNILKDYGISSWSDVIINVGIPAVSCYAIAQSTYYQDTLNGYFTPDYLGDGLILIGPITCNDGFYLTPPQDTKTALAKLANTTWTRNPNYKLVFILDVSSNDQSASPNGNSDNVLPYRTVMTELYNELKAQGKPIYLVDPGYKNPNIEMGPSMVHPTNKGYKAMGEIIGNAILDTVYERVKPSPTATPIIIQNTLECLFSPNPNPKTFHIKANANSVKLKVFTVAYSKVFEMEYNIVPNQWNNISFNISLPNGVYLYSINDKNLKKFMVLS